jgi:ribosomal protein S14
LSPATWPVVSRFRWQSSRPKAPCGNDGPILTSLGLQRRCARRLASRPPLVGARIKEPARTVEVACFLRHCLFTNTYQATPNRLRP